jgi:hypothetical protein
MAHSQITMYHPASNLERIAPIGFSWTNLLFGALVPAFRSDWKWFIIQFLCAIITSGISWFVFPFFYNELYKKELLSQGYKERGAGPPVLNKKPDQVNKTNDNLASLERLGKMYKDGLLTKDEFEIKKKEFI